VENCNTIEEIYFENDFGNININNHEDETSIEDFDEKSDIYETDEKIIIREEPENGIEKNNNDEKIQDEIDENIDDEPDDPINSFELEFTLDLDEIYGYQEPIPVTAIIKNIGEKTVNLCEMDVKIRSLDFDIETPEGKLIHYIGPFEGKGQAVKINPFQSIAYQINLTSKNVTFGEIMDEPAGLYAPYNFPPGSYTIKGIYISHQVITAETADYFQGVLDSPLYRFTIKEGPITPN
jgi:hypothetical protein